VHGLTGQEIGKIALAKRLPVLWAKAGTFAVVAFVLTLIATFVGFYGAQAILTQHHVQTTLGHAPALRAVIGAALYLSVLGVFCSGLGALVRNTAGSVASDHPCTTSDRAMRATSATGSCSRCRSVTRITARPFASITWSRLRLCSKARRWPCAP
jgi:hypothetical protein